MIKYNLNTINDWFFSTDNIIKVYRNNAICYYKIDSSSPSGQTPCYAVVDDITQYQDTEFEDVFNKADNKWYKLNNLNQYEEYGVYGSGRTSCEGSTSRLPQGYTEVEYISSEDISESVLGPYIDTNYKPTQNTRFVIEYQSTTNTRDYQRIFGSGEFDMLGYLVNIEGKIGTSGYYYYKFGQTSRWYTTSVQCDLNRHVIDYNNSKQFLLDNVSIATLPNNTFTCSSNLGIFWSINTKYTTNNINFIGRIFSAKVYENGILVRDFVPCISPNNVVGMYDIVNNVFYTSSNNYSFKAGDPIAPTHCVTTYNGKLTIDGDYEYIYSGNSWVNVGEVSGGTASLPDVSFMLNYNAKEYDSTNNQIPQTSGQLQNVDAVCNYGYHIIDHSADGYISITGNSRFICSGNSGTYLNRTNTQTGCTMTIVSKAKTNSGYSILTNRQGNGTTHLNWMYRQYADGYMKLHGKTDTQQIACSTTEPNILSVRTLYNGGVKSYMNNWSLGTSTSQATFAYLNTGTRGGALFCDYSDVNTEFWQGDFYWIYMSQNVLTDEQIQQVIDYNESSGGTVEYPIYYDEMQDPPNNLTFSSMAEAEEYECPWVGMKATIDGDNYVFSGDAISGYEWVEVVLPYDAEIEYLESSGSQYINTNQYLNTSNFEIGYSVLGNRGHWGYAHNNVVNGAWVTVDETTAFFGSFNNTDKVSVSSYISSTENTIVYTQSGATINGTTISKNFNLRGVDNLASVPLLFFALHDFYNNSLIYSNSKFKSFYLKNNGTLVVDMIPVRVGQVGYMYDRVSGQLFGNAGTGSFILGSDK